MSFKDRKMNEDKAIELAKEITRKIEGRDIFLKGTIPDEILYTPELEVFKLYSVLSAFKHSDLLSKLIEQEIMKPEPAQELKDVNLKEVQKALKKNPNVKHLGKTKTNETFRDIKEENDAR